MIETRGEYCEFYPSKLGVLSQFSNKNLYFFLIILSINISVASSWRNITLERSLEIMGYKRREISSTASFLLIYPKKTIVEKQIE